MHLLSATVSPSSTFRLPRRTVFVFLVCSRALVAQQRGDWGLCVGFTVWMHL